MNRSQRRNHIRHPVKYDHDDHETTEDLLFEMESGFLGICPWCKASLVNYPHPDEIEMKCVNCGWGMFPSRGMFEHIYNQAALANDEEVCKHIQVHLDKMNQVKP